VSIFVLTKRATDGKEFWHRVYGATPNIQEARTWYRATRTTDVFEIHTNVASFYQNAHWDGNEQGCHLSDTKLESWREQHAREEREIAGGK
jgi:hypothetical protein